MSTNQRCPTAATSMLIGCLLLAMCGCCAAYGTYRPPGEMKLRLGRNGKIRYTFLRTQNWIASEIADVWPAEHTDLLQDIIAKDSKTGTGSSLFLLTPHVLMPWTMELDRLQPYSVSQENFGKYYTMWDNKPRCTRAPEECTKEPKLVNKRQIVIKNADVVVLWKLAVSQETRYSCGTCQMVDRKWKCKKGGILAAASAKQYIYVLDKNNKTLFVRPSVIAVTLCQEAFINDNIRRSMGTVAHEVMHGFGMQSDDYIMNKAAFYIKSSGTYLVGAENRTSYNRTREFIKAAYVPETMAAMSEYFQCEDMEKAGVLGYEWENKGHPDSRVYAGSLMKVAVSRGWYTNTMSPVSLAFLNDQRFYTEINQKHGYAKWTDERIMGLVGGTKPIRTGDHTMRDCKAKSWYGRNAGCAFLTDGCREFMLKRINKFGKGIRHAPGFPYCTSYDVLKEMQYLMDKAFTKKQVFPLGSTIPMCYRGAVVGMMRCRIDVKEKNEDSKEYWPNHVPYSADIVKWIKADRYPWFSIHSEDLEGKRNNLLLLLPKAYINMDGCPIFEPVAIDGHDGIREWGEIYPQAQPCYCNQVGLTIPCDYGVDHVAVDTLDDEFAPNMTEFEQTQYNEAAEYARLNGAASWRDKRAWIMICANHALLILYIVR